MDFMIENEVLKMTKYIRSLPTVTQTTGLIIDCVPEVLFGGAAGGGKTEWHLMAALQYVDYEHYDALILMKTFPDLMKPGALIDKSKQWLGDTDAKWNGSDKRWTFPSGATLNFGYMQTEDDKYNFKTAEYQHIGFDELTAFSKTQYQYMFSRLRRKKGSVIPLRMRASANPDGVGFEWVRAHFVKRKNDDQRVFIPSRIQDNPHIDAEGYIKSLMHLDPITRQRLLDGDWDVRPEGKKFQRHWFRIVREAPKMGRVVRFWDLAATEEPKSKKSSDPDYTAGAKVLMTPEGLFYILDMVQMRGTPKQVEDVIRRTAEYDTREVEIFMEEEPGSAGKHVIDHFTRRVLRGYAFKGIRPTGSKEVRSNPVASQAEAGNISLLESEWNQSFLDELQAFPTVGIHDDRVDAFVGAVTQLTEPEFKYQTHYTDTAKGYKQVGPEHQRPKRRGPGKSLFDLEKEGWEDNNE